MRILSYLIDYYSPPLCKIVELKRLTLRGAISIEMYRRGRPRGLELWDSRRGGRGGGGELEQNFSRLLLNRSKLNGTGKCSRLI